MVRGCKASGCFAFGLLARKAGPRPVEWVLTRVNMSTKAFFHVNFAAKTDMWRSGMYEFEFDLRKG